jgi:hypothetical protein
MAMVNQLPGVAVVLQVEFLVKYAHVFYVYGYSQVYYTALWPALILGQNVPSMVFDEIGCSGKGPLARPCLRPESLFLTKTMLAPSGAE